METYIVKKKNGNLLLFKEEQEIGQVSPEATWVVENQEFDEDEIDTIYYDKERNYGEVEFVRIKGPCGHFH